MKLKYLNTALWYYGRDLIIIIIESLSPPARSTRLLRLTALFEWHAHGNVTSISHTAHSSTWTQTTSEQGQNRVKTHAHNHMYFLNTLLRPEIHEKQRLAQTRSSCWSKVVFPASQLTLYIPIIVIFLDDIAITITNKSEVCNSTIGTGLKNNDFPESFKHFQSSPNW